MNYKKFTYRELFVLADNKKLVLPNFQRKFVWKVEDQKLLLASFFVKLPIGNFLLLEGDGDQFYSKELCFNTIFKPEGDCFYLLDGQQRLSSLKNIFIDQLSFTNWRTNIDKHQLYYSLQTKWFLELKDDEDEIDILGLKNLRFKKREETDDGKKTLKPIPMTLEPSQVIGNIVNYRIFKDRKQHTNFYHPWTSSRQSTLSLFN